MSRVEPEAFHEAIAAQRRASDPQVSAFVEANAGAGKTSVLTARVARLLLAGAPPAKILCITYTKAAAAEMADRLLKLLGAWALADDRTLGAKLEEIEGEASKKRCADDLARARGLFARALETPGGLKIQTIHSFCESVLRRFPIETAAPPGFSVLDEKDAVALARIALDSAQAEPASAAALHRLTASLDPDKLADLAIGQILSRQKIEDAKRHAGGFEGLRRGCPAYFGVDPGATAQSLRAAAVASVSDEDVRRLQAAFRSGAKTCQGFASKELALLLASGQADERFDLLAGVLLTGAGKPREKFPDAQVKAAHPWAEGFCRDLAARFVAATAHANAADNCADTIAFLTLLEGALDAYGRLKQARAGLDYDDLIERTRDLFADEGGASWVRYKLDQGVDHILLDEGQDTSPAQWAVIEGPLKEFISGESAREGARTFFAVGDKKQSIYSFQGADAALFAEKEQDLGKAISAAQEYRNVPLRLSFRSAAPILDFVDALFEPKEALEGVGADWPLRHELRRVGAAGSVELWPLTPKAQTEKGRAWDAPLDAIGEDNPARRLAAELAKDIRRRIGSDMLLSRGRPLQAKDVLILVQSRGALFHETIRALSRAGVPVAGADRIRLLEEPAVDDILSFARAALLWSDDLSLAETLRSPFFSVSEQSLYDLAYGRDASLRETLRRRADERPEWAEANAAISRAERIGRDEGAFAFISHLLEEGNPSGRKRLYARLSRSAEEPLNELLRQALDYEQRHPRSLQGFVNWVERDGGEIRRDPDQAGDAARVMTVHGAKGLEAEVVILLDAHKGPNLAHLGPLFYAGARGRLAPILSASAPRDSAPAAAAREEAKRKAYEEYRRLLYVAATRARDRLIVCGVELGNAGDPMKKGIAQRTWHALATDALGRLGAREDRQAPWGGAIRVFDSAQYAPVETDARGVESADAAPPAWLFTAAPAETRRRPLAPSSLGGAAFADVAYSPLRPSDRLVRGKALHRLIELLPEVDDARRAETAERLLARHAPRVAADERGRWAEEALAVVRDPAFGAVFGPRSKAEVAVAGTIATPSGARYVSGKIDRLAVEKGRLLIVDYKTNRPPPKRVEDIPPAYAAQLAAYRSLLRDVYPELRAEAALLWTYDACLMAVPDAMLDSAFEALIGAA